MRMAAASATPIDRAASFCPSRALRKRARPASSPRLRGPRSALRAGPFHRDPAAGEALTRAAQTPAQAIADAASACVFGQILKDPASAKPLSRPGLPLLLRGRPDYRTGSDRPHRGQSRKTLTDSGYAANPWIRNCRQTERAPSCDQESSPWGDERRDLRLYRGWHVREDAKVAVGRPGI